MMRVGETGMACTSLPCLYARDMTDVATTTVLLAAPFATIARDRLDARPGGTAPVPPGPPPAAAAATETA